MMLQAHHMQRATSAGGSETDVFLMKISSLFEFNPTPLNVVVQTTPSHSLIMGACGQKEKGKLTNTNLLFCLMHLRGE